MPTVHRSGPYRFYFYSSDRDEPVHVHVQRDASTAKFWLEPVRLADSVGFSRVELGRVEPLVVENAEMLLRAWNDFFTE